MDIEYDFMGKYGMFSFCKFVSIIFDDRYDERTTSTSHDPGAAGHYGPRVSVSTRV